MFTSDGEHCDVWVDLWATLYTQDVGNTMFCVLQVTVNCSCMHSSSVMKNSAVSKPHITLSTISISKLHAAIMIGRVQ